MMFPTTESPGAIGGAATTLEVLISTVGTGGVTTAVEEATASGAVIAIRENTHARVTRMTTSMTTTPTGRAPLDTAQMSIMGTVGPPHPHGVLVLQATRSFWKAYRQISGLKRCVHQRLA